MANQTRKSSGKNPVSMRGVTPAPDPERQQKAMSKGEPEMDQELHKLFLDELADLLNAELQLTKALPKMARAAQSPELAEAFQSHLEETNNHLERLRQVFTMLEEEPESKTCQAMKGLLEEGAELMEEYKGSSALDAALIAAAQKVEHYEIASYGTVIAWAAQMEHMEAADLLQETLNEERAADEKLTLIAEAAASEKVDKD